MQIANTKFILLNAISLGLIGSNESVLHQIFSDVLLLNF